MDKTHKIKLIIILIIGIAIGGFTFSNTSSEAQKSWDGGTYAPTFEQEIFNKTNAYRASLGLPALQPNSTLKNKARGWATYMLKINEAQHSNVETNNGEAWIILGENVGTAENSQIAFDLLLASPTHRANIVDPRFTHMAVGAIEYYGFHFYAQEFMQLPIEEVPTTTQAPIATTTPKKSATVYK